MTVKSVLLTGNRNFLKQLNNGSMKFTIYFFSIVMMLALACTNQKNDDKGVSATAEVVSAESQVLDVAAVLAESDTYHQKEVMLKGTVVHVCKHSGKRLHLMSEDEKTRIRVEAGDIGKFEKELEGSDIVVTGTFVQEVIDEEYLAKWSEEMKGDHEGEHKYHDEAGEEQAKMKQYRKMMKESADGRITNFWVEGISFELAEAGAEI